VSVVLDFEPISMFVVATMGPDYVGANADADADADADENSGADLQQTKPRR